MDNNTSNIENESNIENTSNIENESNHNRDMAMVSEDFSGKLILKYVLEVFAQMVSILIMFL